MRQQLQETERLMGEMEMTWEERLKQTEQIVQEKQQVGAYPSSSIDTNTRWRAAARGPQSQCEEYIRRGVAGQL